MEALRRQSQQQSQYQQSCQKCKLEVGDSDSLESNLEAEIQGSSSSAADQDESQASSSSENQIRVPLHYQTLHRNDKIENTIALLQYQITKLKKQNQEKDHLINKLQKKVKNSQRLHQQSSEQKSQIEKFKQKIRQKRDSSKRSKQQLIGRKGSSIQIQYQQNNRKLKQKANIYKDYGLEDDSSNACNSSRLTNKQSDRKNSQTFNRESFEEKRKENKNIEFLTNQIKLLQNQTNKLQIEMRWIGNFLTCFLNLTERTSAIFHEKVLTHSWSLKKKVKTAWRYMKHLLKSASRFAQSEPTHFFQGFNDFQITRRI